MTPHTSIAVRASCRSSKMTHSQFIAQKTKDAVVDALRDQTGARPSVDRIDPDVGIAVHLARDHATLYLDVSGASLHERGWRSNAGVAPLRETLAAAIVRLSGWDRTQPFIDPMCGAGTLAIEAAAWARAVAPGLSRERFGFERWASYDSALRERVRHLREEARDAPRRLGPVVRASDRDETAVERTRENARRAGVELVVTRRDVRDLCAIDARGSVVTNPPYGERLDAEVAVFRDLGRALQAMRDHSFAFLAGSPALGRALGRRPDRFWILHNGPIECRLLVFDADRSLAATLGDAT